MLALLVVGGLVVGHKGRVLAVVHRAEKVQGEVAALAAAATDDHERGGAGDGALRLGAVVRPRNLADVVGGRVGVVHRDVGLGVVGVVLGDPTVGRLVDGKTRGDDAVVQRDAIVGVNGARAGAAVDGVRGKAADEGDLGA